jgi:CheY-like chemotaxis protein
LSQVLDFAKINNLTRGASKRQKKRTQSAKHMINPGQAHTNDIMTLINDVDMSVLTEDVVESVFAGYTYQRTSAQSYESSPDPSEKPAVSIILDINPCENYVFRTQPGAWKRVVMNLIGNSLKYTPAGYVKVKLEVKPKRSTADECCEFRFTVTDSGIGMSEDYVNNRLFHSFAQENPLSQGTGLGLSIVKQIVESLGGEVEVRSEKGRGTKFTVTCPLKESAMSPSFCAAGSEQEKEKQLREVRKRTKDLRIRFVGFDEEEEYFVKSLKNKTATKMSLKALDGLCTDWFGMTRCGEKDEPDIVVATESCAKWLRTQHSQDPNKAWTAPVIVVCQGAASAQSTTAITVPGIIFECIAQPVGPHKMSKALSSCLDRHRKRMMAHLEDGADSAMQHITQLSLKENAPPGHNGVNTENLDIPRPPLSHVSSAPEIRSITTTQPRKSIYMKPTRSLNCLAVDDNPINLRLLRTFVDKLGHRHVLATNGLEAVEAYKAAQTPAILGTALSQAADEFNHIDAVLIDINMPIMDGLEATRQIRAHEIRNNLPKVTIIALTGVADSEIQQEANSSGINLFLIKPVRLADLEVILKGVITGQDTARLDAKLEIEGAKMALAAQELEAYGQGPTGPGHKKRLSIVREADTSPGAVTGVHFKQSIRLD